MSTGKKRKRTDSYMCTGQFKSYSYTWVSFASNIPIPSQVQTQAYIHFRRLKSDCIKDAYQ
jgi:hypothetical protein